MIAAAASVSMDSAQNMAYDKGGEALEAAGQTGENINVSVQGEQLKDRFPAFGKSYVVEQEFGRISPKDIGAAVF